MIKILLILILFPFPIFSEVISLEAVRSVNGYAGASDYCTDAVSSSDGGIITSGYCADEYTSYALLIKYNSGGGRVWLKTFREGINGKESYSKIILDVSGNIYVAGGSYNAVTNNDILIQKYNPSGDLQWTKKINSLSGNSDILSEFKMDRSGNLLILFNEQTNSHINLAKLDLSGNPLWHYRLADTVSTGYSMSLDSLNNIYISGSRNDAVFSPRALILKINKDGNQKWKKEGSSGNDREVVYSKIIAGSDNEIYVLGDKTEGFNRVMKIEKIDSNGNQAWAEFLRIPRDGALRSKALELDRSGNIFYAAAFIPVITDNPEVFNSGYYFGRFSPQGDSAWSVNISNVLFSSGSDDAVFMKINNLNEISILCYETTTDLGQRSRILKYNTDGVSLASGSFISGYGTIFSLALDNSGNPVGCGAIPQNYNEYDHFVKSYTSSYQTNWESKYDSKGFSSDKAGRVLEDKEGNIYLAGYNNRQAMLIKYNEALTEQWKYIVSDSVGFDPYYNFEPSIVSDISGNIYFSTSVKVDSTAYDILISKIDPSGNYLFSVRIAAPGNSTAQLRAMTTDDLGYLIISGATNVGFIAKYTPTGNQMWIRNYTESYYYQKLIANEEAIYFMGDNTIIKYAKTGDPLWVRTFQPNSFVNFFLDFKVDRENSVIACGSGVLQDSRENYIIVKYDSDGNQEWNKYYNGLRNSYDEANSIDVDSLNNVIVSGRAFESLSVPRASLTMLKLDPSGNQIWKKIISNPLGEIAPGKVSVDKFDNVYVSSGGGRNVGFASVNFSYLLVKYKSNGDSVWSTVYNHPEYKNFASDYVITGNNSIVMTGKAYGNNTGYDITTLKYSQTVGILSNSTKLPDKFYLAQNYPNPFNPVTHLGFGISNLGFVSLRVFDALGKEVAVLVNENLSPGIYEAVFDGSNYPSGIYYYKLEAGSFSVVRKMILLK